MILIKDDPIIACMERTGWAPWDSPEWDDQEIPEEHDDYFNSEPFAVYDPEE